MELIRIPPEVHDGRDDESREEDEDEDEDEGNCGLVDMAADGYDVSRETFAKKMRSHVKLIHDFCDSLEHQIQFGDHCFLKTLEKDGARFLRLAENCMTQEQRLNLSCSASPTTWETATTNAMFYCSWPQPSSQGT